MTALLLAITLSAPAFADEVEALTYQLTLNGAPVGERTVTVRYFREGGREVRLLESYTDLSFALGKSNFVFQQRTGGHGGSPAGTFTSSVLQSDKPREIQAVHRDDGWLVTVVQPRRKSEERYTDRQVDATSLTLVDPGAAGFLSGKVQLKVLTSETGLVLEGPLRAGGETTLTIGGEQVDGEVWLWSPAEGPVELVYGESGHLLRYTMTVAGAKVEALLTAAPQARTYGETLEVDGLITAGGIGEEAL